MTYEQRASRRLRLTLLIGLIVTAAVGAAPVIDLVSIDTVAAHVRDAYPAWPDSYVAGERTAITAYLVAIGGLGAAAWAWSLARARRRSIRATAIVLFVIGIAVAAAHLSVATAQYERVIPPAYGLLWTLPVAIGACAVVAVFRTRREEPSK